MGRLPGVTRWWCGRNGENLVGWSDLEDPGNLIRLAAPFAQQDLPGEGHALRTCGMAVDVCPYGCYRRIMFGKCEFSSYRCYCTGAKRLLARLGYTTTPTRRPASTRVNCYVLCTKLQCRDN